MLEMAQFALLCNLKYDIQTIEHALYVLYALYMITVFI